MHEKPVQLGPFLILDPIGKGSYGVVYRARHTQTGALAAVKTIPELHPSIQASMRREIQVLARLQHPGVVPIWDQGVEQQRPWYAMEFVDGPSFTRHCGISARTTRSHPSTTGVSGTLPAPPSECAETAQYLETPSSGDLSRSSGSSRRSWPPDASWEPDPIPIPPIDHRYRLDAGTLHRILLILRQISETLEFVHAQGVVHCDLKPGNILLRGDASPVLVDFGLTSLARDERGRDRVDRTGVVVGTPEYMAPEQIRRELLDARADLYALGCILYELLTGRPPFLGPDAKSILAQHLHAAPLPVSFWTEGIPDGLSALVCRLLVKNRQERLGHAADLTAWMRELLGEPTPPKQTRPPFNLYRPALVGREKVLKRLQSRMDGLILQRGGLVLLGGESGVGKTRLLLELSRTLPPYEHLLLIGECLSGEHLPGERPSSDRNAAGDSRLLASTLQPIRQALEPVLDRCRDEVAGSDLAQKLFSPHASVMVSWFPDLASLRGLSALTAPPPLPPAEARIRLFQSLEQVFAALSREFQVLLLLDDLQWSDPYTLQFLQYLLRNGFFDRNPVLVVCGYRQDELTPELASLKEAPSVEVLELGRLDRGAVGAIIKDMLAIREVPEAFVDLLVRASAGNPFFVAEYLRSAVTSGLVQRHQGGAWSIELEALGEDGLLGDTSLSVSEALYSLISKRLQALPAPVLAIAMTAAVVGRESPADLLEVLCQQQSLPWVEGLQELLLRQVLEPADGGQYRFVHDSLRELAYAMQSPPEKASRHLLVAAGIELFAELRHPPLGLLGRHWAAGGDAASARRCYLIDARRAQGRELSAEAETLYRAYLQLSPGPSLERLQAREQLVRVLRHRGGGTQEAFALASLNLEEARSSNAPLLIARCLDAVADIHYRLRQIPEALAHSDQALQLYRSLQDQEGEAYTLHRFCLIYLGEGRLDEAEALWRNALTLTQQLGLKGNEATMLNNLGLICSRQGRLEEAEALWKQSYTLRHELGQRHEEGKLLLNLCVTHYFRGDLEQAVYTLQQALNILEEVRDLRSLPRTLLSLAHLYALQADTDALAGLRVKVRLLQRQTDEPYGQALLITIRSMLEHQLGSWVEAQAHGEEALSLHQKMTSDRLQGLQLQILASISLDLGQVEKARSLLGESLAFFRRLQEKEEEARVLTLLAGLERQFAPTPHLACGYSEAAIALASRIKNRFVELYAVCERGLTAAALHEPLTPWLERARALVSYVRASSQCRVLLLYRALEHEALKQAAESQTQRQE